MRSLNLGKWNSLLLLWFPRRELQAKLIQEAVFSSVARDQASPSSDVDLLNRRRPLGVADCYDFT